MRNEQTNQKEQPNHSTERDSWFLKRGSEEVAKGSVCVVCSFRSFRFVFAIDERVPEMREAK